MSRRKGEGKEADLLLAGRGYFFAPMPEGARIQGEEQSVFDIFGEGTTPGISYSRKKEKGGENKQILEESRV